MANLVPEAGQGPEKSVAIDLRLFQDVTELHSEMVELEQRVDAFEKHLKAFVTLSESLYENERVNSEHSSRLSSELTHLAPPRSAEVDPLFQPAMQQFGNIMRSIDDLRAQLMQNMENLFKEPLQEFLDREFRELKELRKQFEKASDDYEAAFVRVAAFPNKNAKKEPAIAEMGRLKHVLDVAGFDYLRKMKEIESKKNFEFLERICSYMVSQTAYFHEGYEMMKEYGGFIQNVTGQLMHMRTDFASSQEILLDSRKLLSDQYKRRGTAVFGHPGSNRPMQGFLMKRSSSMRRDWKKRWFVIFNGTIQYHRSWRDLEVLGSLNLLTASVKPALGKDIVDRENCFEIISPNRKFMLQAPCSAEMEAWMLALGETTSELISSGLIDPAKSISDRVIDSLVTKSSSPVAQVGNEDVVEVIQNFDRLNKVCADCGDSNPSWVSINCGVVLCLTCAGIHRKFGVHVSKVRSLRLDSVDAEVLEIMQQLGNGSMNSMYEFALPPGVKPGPRNSPDEKERFIRMKYMDMEFVELQTLNHAKNVKELFLAVENNDILSVAALLIQGVVLSAARDISGHTALHIAAQKDWGAMCEFLFQNQSPINAKNATRETALHLAAERNCMAAATVLVRHSAAKSPRNSEGKTAFEIACERGFTEMAVDVIVDKGWMETADFADEDYGVVVRPIRNISIDIRKFFPKRNPPDPPKVARNGSASQQAYPLLAMGAASSSQTSESGYMQPTRPPALPPRARGGGRNATKGRSGAPPLPPRMR